MWDNDHLLRGIANVLFGFSLLLMLYGALRYVAQLPAFSLQAVVLAQAPQRVPVDQVEELVHSAIRGNFFTVDLAQVRDAFQQLPWVRSVSVRRKFPWQLEVTLEEHVALARWNKHALVDTHGEVFAAQTDEVLPEFFGADENAVLMARTYAELGETLQPMQRQIVQLTLSPRMAWQVKLDDGMELALGREAMRERLARFVQVYPYSVAVRMPNARRVDLRYRNGFAVQQTAGAA
ncbi:MAG: cell division protein FtsQ/DivIB [Pseudomonadota bacterium]